MAVPKGGLFTLLLSCGRRERREPKSRRSAVEEEWERKTEGESEDSGADF